MSQIFQQGQRQLLRCFQKSQLYRFFAFLKSSRSKDIITFNPTQDPANPRTYYFQISKLRKACPQLRPCGTQLIPLLQRSGLVTRRIQRQDFKHYKFTSLSHPTLTINSSNEQIMQVWMKHQIQFFMRSRSLIVRMYLSLQTNDKYLHWNEDGTAIVMNPKWQHYSTSLFENLYTFGFSKVCIPEISHRYLRRETPMQLTSLRRSIWLMVYLKMNEKFRAKKWRTKLLKMRSKGVVREEEEEYYEMYKRDALIRTQNIEKEKKKAGNNNGYESIEKNVFQMKKSVAKFQRQNPKVSFGQVYQRIDEIIKYSQKNQIIISDSQQDNEKPPTNALNKLVDELKQMNDRLGALQGKNARVRL